MSCKSAATVVIAGLLVWPAGAEAGGRAGHNAPTKKLEAAFSTALSVRVVDKKGCYPRPSKLAVAIRKRKKLRTGVARGPKATPRRGVVYVLRKGTSCNGVRMALRDKRNTYVLDSVKGEVRILGRKRRKQSAVGNKGPLRALRLVGKSFTLTDPHHRRRMFARCPGKTLPLGGGLVTTPPLGPDGEGVYPHSYERLGAQRGWHVTAWLRDPTVGTESSRTVTVQVMCGKGLAPMSAPHKTVFTKRNRSRAVTARCPRGQYLMSGGYQRTNFLGDGGNYITESRAVGPRAWRVSGRAYGSYGGELTAIAYCVKNAGPLLSEVSASTPLSFGEVAEATTPPCPEGRRLTSGGFSAGGSQSTWFGGGWFTPEGGWSVSGHGRFGSAPALTAYGYCLHVP